MSKYRPEDNEYYVDDRTEHVAQGDIFREIEFEFPLEPELAFTGYGMLINYSSGLLVGKEGTRGYAHMSRLIAPIWDFQVLADQVGWTEEQLADLNHRDNHGRYMYLPPYPGEWNDSVVAPYRAVPKHQVQLDGHRVTQLQLPGAQRLQLRLLRAFLGRDPEAELTPDMKDHWNPQSSR